MDMLPRPPSRIVPRIATVVTRWCATGLLALFMVSTIAQGIAAAAAPEGVWLIDDKVAIEIFDCGGLVCGRILWLKVPRNSLGQLDRDKNNPDPKLRQRQLCGLTIFWDLRLHDQASWTGGWFYNPDDGETYRISAELNGVDRLTARIYRGIPLFGETKTLLEVAHGVSDGWC
jgi:uncharacterized protein (DUF2147 family)